MSLIEELTTALIYADNQAEKLGTEVSFTLTVVYDGILVKLTAHEYESKRVVRWAKLSDWIIAQFSPLIYRISEMVKEYEAYRERSHAEGKV